MLPTSLLARAGRSRCNPSCGQAGSLATPDGLDQPTAIAPGSWLEPDPPFAAELAHRVEHGRLGGAVELAREQVEDGDSLAWISPGVLEREDDRGSLGGSAG